ncbi:cyclin-like protein interacting with PHO85 [Mucor velutinosus]|uniref:Cyclin-like protein interacting with PHO85 n=1 Tax=Mucor velutinosus TaxID=708070 RepID=A0AAN7DK56_9FUNG|nr:cyclin-like protein interacting with PHO85 [Mucor velutinosus]
METHAFVKIANLPAYEKVLLKSSTINEASTKLGIAIGTTIKMEAVTINTISMSREWCKRKSNSMETLYKIGPDHEPRSVYAVYQLSYPLLSSNSTYSTRTQCKEIIRYVAYRKPFGKHTAFAATAFVFYACASKEEDGMQRPKQFLVTEPRVELDHLQCDLNSWQCLHAESTRTSNKTAYVQFDTTQQQLHPYNHGTIYSCAYLNAPKRRLCNQCRHE